MLKIDYYENIYILTWIFNKFSIKIEIDSKHRISLQTFLILKYKNIKSNEKEDVNNIIITNIEEF